MVDLLPMINVVENDPFNSDPNDSNLMGPDVLQRFRKGEKLPVVQAKTPLVRAWTGHSGAAAAAAENVLFANTRLLL